MYPKDAITEHHEVQGNNTTIVYDGGINTILAISMQQENVSSDTTVLCGNDMIGRNYATNFSMVQMNYICDDDILILKTKNDKASVVITYVPYDIAQNDTSFNPSTNIATSSDIQIYGSISAGEFVLSFLIFLLIVIELGKIIVSGIGKVNTRRKYIRYKDSDVEITDDLI